MIAAQFAWFPSPCGDKVNLVLGAVLYERVVKPVGRKISAKIAGKVAARKAKKAEAVDLDDMDIEDIPDIE